MRFKLPCRISVKQEHIDKGVPETQNFCAVALAIGEAVEWASDIRINETTIKFNNRHERETYIYSTPARVAQVVTVFDPKEYRSLVKPFKFRLENPATKRMKEFEKRPGRAVGHVGNPKKTRKMDCLMHPTKRSYGHRTASRIAAMLKGEK